MVKIYDRKEKKYYCEEQYAVDKLNFLYNTIRGRLVLKVIINPVFSKAYSIYKKSSFSKKDINKFINYYSIDMNEYEKIKYKSYNDFFTRKKRRVTFNKNDNVLISPADSKLLAYTINDDLKVKIKGSIYSIEELIKDEISSEFIGGSLLVFRLSLDNYHRYCYVDSGRVLKQKKINGKLHTVCSISKKYKIYKENKRVVSLLETDHFGKMYQIEVGALGVGSIVNKKEEFFKKGEEKGHFEIGGSTVVLILKDNIKIDKDIIENSLKDIETYVEYGEAIGKLIKK